jgi:four helix bundle protein
LADATWQLVSGWQSFEKNTVGDQLVRAADRVGATISEAHGRFHYGEKVNFLYYARGSLYETRFWLRQAYKRQLMNQQNAKEFAEIIEPLAISINSFVGSIKEQRRESNPRTLKETPTVYEVHDPISNQPISTLATTEIFTLEEIVWLTKLTDVNES